MTRKGVTMLNLRTRSKSHLQRAAMLLAVALPMSGCGAFDGWFGEDKKPLPGKRDLVFAERDPLALGTAAALKVTLPAPAAMADWPQAGGRPDHDDEHPAAGAALSRAWTARIGRADTSWRHGSWRRHATSRHRARPLCKPWPMRWAGRPCRQPRAPWRCSWTARSWHAAATPRRGGT